jgi:3-isopropylmalate/(R)-2-methylmalate dehydratase small subunit
VVVSPEFLEKIFAAIEADNNAQFEVDLENQKFTICATGESTGFTINPYKKHCLANGLDDIDYLVSIKDEISAFEAK